MRAISPRRKTRLRHITLPAAQHPSVFINAIGTAVPDHDVHHAFIDWAQNRVANQREQKLFARMAARAGIAHRWSVLPKSIDGGSPVGPGGFYHGVWPGTAQRMNAYSHAAPALALNAIAALHEQVSLDGITHLVVASCTGFVAPGVDQIIAEHMGLASSVERLMVGFMGCYAAVSALRSARHIVRSEPDARVLVVCVELSSLHLQATDALEPLLAMLQFGDGAAAALVSADAKGLILGQPFATTLPDTAHLIQWHVGDHGFAMHLSGAVPGAIAAALANQPLLPCAATEVDGWAVHAGGRSILDAVVHGLDLPPDALNDSRAVLEQFGNMSSATLMFVLARMLARDPVEQPHNGIALAFGPGLAAEGFGFSRV